MAPQKPSRKKVTTPSEPSFEERLAALERVVADLEGEELSLEASLERYKEGVGHLTACRALLDDAGRRLVELVEDGEGATERPLRVGEGGLEPGDDQEA